MARIPSLSSLASLQKTAIPESSKYISTLTGLVVFNQFMPSTHRFHVKTLYCTLLEVQYQKKLNVACKTTMRQLHAVTLVKYHILLLIGNLSDSLTLFGNLKIDEFSRNRTSPGWILPFCWITRKVNRKLWRIIYKHVKIMHINFHWTSFCLCIRTWEPI